MSRDSYGEVTLAFILGAVVGAGVALLYAPASGSETRRKLADAAGRLREQSLEGYEKATDYLSEKVDTGKTYVQDRKDEVAAAVAAGKDAYRKAKEQH